MNFYFYFFEFRMPLSLFGHWTLDKNIGEPSKQVKCQVRPASTSISDTRSFNGSQYQAKTSYKPNKWDKAMLFIRYPLRAGCQFLLVMKSSLSRHCLIPSCPSQFFLNVTIMPYAAWFEKKERKILCTFMWKPKTLYMLSLIRQRETEVDLIIQLHWLGQMTVRACSVLQGKNLDNGELRAVPQRG